jgi:Uma2 family endonuclease
VPDYWIVDLQARRVECWRPGAVHASLHERELVWQPRSDRDPLRIDLVAFLAAQP